VGEIAVAALYVEKDGCYFGLDDVDPWDEERDARLYAGPWPVVAHPPCQRWCRLAGMIETRYGYKVGDDGGCFEAALTAVRQFGGVLEHPARTLAWRPYGLPEPFPGTGWTMVPDDYGGYSIQVDQGWYGHPLAKPTWLYAVGVELPALHVGSGPGGRLPHRDNTLSATQRERMTIPSPPAFRDVLLNMARSATAARSVVGRA